jgi:hypothetical protein
VGARNKDEIPFRSSEVSTGRETRFCFVKEKIHTDTNMPTSKFRG